jgi:hypothetical protein
MQEQPAWRVRPQEELVRAASKRETHDTPLASSASIHRRPRRVGGHDTPLARRPAHGLNLLRHQALALSYSSPRIRRVAEEDWPRPMPRKKPPMTAVGVALVLADLYGCSLLSLVSWMVNE